MQQIGAAKIRGLENEDRDKLKVKNMLEKVRYCLQNNNFDGAREAAHSLGWKYRKSALEIFEEHRPEPVKCEKCGTALEWIFVDGYIDWKKPNCPVCEYNSVKATIKDKCSEIMSLRGIPKRYLNASLGDFSKNFRQQLNTDFGLFSWGAPGTGKTHLMAAQMSEDILNTEPVVVREDYFKEPGQIYSEPALRGYPLYVSVPEFLLKIRGTFNGQSDTDESEIIKKYSEANVLYLDDLGVEKATDWALQTIYLIIDRRYSEMLRTTISSNLNLDQLAARLDDRIASRIAGMCEIIKMAGGDRRLRD